jgi:hypothetical protein
VGRESEIKMIAYRIWQEEGCCNGNDTDNWLKAESIWEENNKPQKPAVTEKLPTISPKPLPAGQTNRKTTSRSRPAESRSKGTRKST